MGIEPRSGQDLGNLSEAEYIKPYMGGKRRREIIRTESRVVKREIEAERC